jgi:hypothetical protein
MQTYYVQQFISGWNLSRPDAKDHSLSLQGQLYSRFNAFSQENPNWGRVCAIPVSLADVALETIKSPLAVIENIALAIINFLGAVGSVGYKFKNSYTLKESLMTAQMALCHVVTTPVAIFMAMPKLAFQFFAIVIDPKTVQSITAQSPTYKVPVQKPA